jgi:drug/metabolite transporter (DMT)-like permease
MSRFITTMRQGFGLSDTTLGIGFASFAALSFAFGAFIASTIVGPDTPGLIIAFYEALFGFVIVSTVYRRDLRGVGRLSRKALVWIILTATGLAFGFGGIYSALARADLSVVAPIGGVVPLVSYVTVMVVLRGTERLTWRAAAGATLVVGGVVLIAISN